MVNAPTEVQSLGAEDCRPAEIEEAQGIMKSNWQTDFAEPVCVNQQKLSSELGRQRSRFFDDSFYLAMSLVIAFFVAYGFSRTISTGLIHPQSPQPLILYFHAVIFSGWVLFFILQSALIRTRNVTLHRQLGWFGFALGLSIPIIGIATTIAMTRLRMQEGRADALQFTVVPFFDMVSFTVAFGLAIVYRKRLEFHRRLMLIATCTLTAAAFGRFPNTLIPHHWFYAGVDALILLGLVRDLLVPGRVHPVYRVGFPIMAAGQTAAMLTYMKSGHMWIRLAHAIVG